MEIKFVERRNWDKKTRLLSNIDKAKKILNYNPKVEFREGLEYTYNWFRSNWDDILKSAEFTSSVKNEDITRSRIRLA